MHAGLRLEVVVLAAVLSLAIGPSAQAEEAGPWRLTQEMSVELPGLHGNLGDSGQLAEMRVYEDDHLHVRLELACTKGCRARFEQRLDEAEFRGVLVLGVHPATGEVDLATIWGAGTGIGVYVYNLSSTRISQVLDAHTNVTPEFNIDYFGHDGLAIPDEEDASSHRYDGATVYTWNGAKFDERRVKRFKPRPWWGDGRR
jgi:hypothetical protein